MKVLKQHEVLARYMDDIECGVNPIWTTDDGLVIELLETRDGSAQFYIERDKDGDYYSPINEEVALAYMRKENQ